MRETIKKPDPVRPEDIEKRSMEIICQELGERTFPAVSYTHLAEMDIWQKKQRNIE